MTSLLEAFGNGAVIGIVLPYWFFLKHQTYENGEGSSLQETSELSFSDGQLAPYFRRVRFFLDNSERVPMLGKGSILFLGCGTCEEVFCFKMLNEKFELVGLDIALNRITPLGSKLSLVRGDASALPFRDGALQVCYCFHVLEHIDDYSSCIGEIARVLDSSGELFLSTPNSKRVIGYLMSARNETLKTIIKWNLREWIARARGNFSHDKGYHTGFSLATLCPVLRNRFKKVRFLTSEYTIHVSRRTVFEPLMRLFNFMHILEVIAPSHAVLCQLPSKD